MIPVSYCSDITTFCDLQCTAYCASAGNIQLSILFLNPCVSPDIRILHSHHLPVSFISARFYFVVVGGGGVSRYAERAGFGFDQELACVCVLWCVCVCV